MVFLDGIVFSLQRHGGISVYFQEIYERLLGDCAGARMVVYEGSDSNASLAGLKNRQGLIKKSGRPLERYRKCAVDEGCVFHSSYYRVPGRKVPSVTTVHDFTYENFVGGPRRWLHAWQKNESIKQSDAVICISENTAKDLVKYCKVDDSKVKVVYNGVSSDYQPLSEYDLTTNQVLFVGSRAAHKNFWAAVSAISQCMSLELTVVGGGDFTEKERVRLETMLPGRYRHMGHLSNSQLNYIYNSSYCLLYPSSYEGFGIPIIEAMRAGCPVIAVNASSIPEVAGDAALLVERPEADLIVDALNMLKIGRERETLVHAGFARARMFSWDRCYEETRKIYKSLQ